MNAKAFFINYHEQINSDELRKKLDISLTQHPEYNKLVKLLKDPIFKDHCCSVNDYLLKLQPVAKQPLFLKNLFKK